MKILNVITLLISVAALALSIVSYNRYGKRQKPTTYVSIEELTDSIGTNGIFQSGSEGDIYFRYQHRAEAQRTFSISDTLFSPDKKLAIVLTRFECGGKRFKEASWAREIDGKWIREHYFSTYLQENDPIIRSNSEWIDLANEKASAWKKSSDSVFN